MSKEQICKLLTTLGLSEKEAQIYLTLLEIPDALSSTIARKTSVKRSTTYVILDELQKLGLVRRFKHKGFTRFQAISPHNFFKTKYSDCTQKIAIIKQLETELSTLLSKRKNQSFQTIIPNLTFEDTSRSIVNEMMTKISPIGGAIFTAEKETGLLRGLHTTNSATGRFAMKIIRKDFSSILIPYDFPINDVGRCAAEKRIIIKEKVEDFAYPTISKTLARQIQKFGGIKTLVALPITANDELQGVLILCFKEKPLIIKSELERMKLFRDQAALAINNAKKQEEFQLRYQVLTGATTET